MTPRLLACLLPLAALLPAPASAQVDDDDDDGPARPQTEITAAARRLDAASENINPALGASAYVLSNETIEGRPGGETVTIGKILLQGPGVVQDATGQLRVRQSAGGLQYRINNVILPDGLTDPGDTLSARLAAKVELVTGALPAQYGLQTGGVVNITTKDGVYLNGGQAEVYGGSRGTLQPAFEYGGSAGSLNFFATGQFQRSNAGLAATDGSASSRHNGTTQGEGMAYFDRVIGGQDRVSLIVSASDERFQIPDPRGRVASGQAEATRRDANQLAVVSYLHAVDRFSVQLSGFVRGSRAVTDTVDAGDIALFGFGRTSRELAVSFGLQSEVAWEPAEAHTIRGGIVITSALRKGRTTTLAYPVDPSGSPTSGSLLTIAANNRVRRRTDGAFLQDEWRLADAITLNFGGRIDHTAGDGERTAFSPRTSAVWRPDPDTTVHLGYARYFTPPPIEVADDEATPLAATTARRPGLRNDPLRSETDDYYDIGVERRLGDLTVGIDAYWRAASAMLDEVQPAGIYQTVPFNFAKGRVRGIEISATFATGRFSAWANMSLAEAWGRGIVSNQSWFLPSVLALAETYRMTLSGAQRFTASGGLGYRVGNLRLAGDILFGSGMPATSADGVPNASRLPAYVQLNASLVWRAASFHDRPLDLRFDVINLFDARYRLHDGSGLVPGVPAWGPRRGVYFGIEQGF